jgi:tape measure domain-containing protein
MATSDNVKDVALNLKIAASGGEQVKVIADALHALAKEGGAASPEILQLSESLRDLGKQSGALQTFKELDGEVTQATAALQSQAAVVAELKAAYDKQADETNQFAESQKKAKNALNETKESIDKTQAQLRLLKSEQAGLTKGTQAYNDKLDELNAKIANERNLRDEQVRASKAANAALAESNAKLKDAAGAYNDANAKASQFSSNLTTQKTALDGAKATMAQLGVEANTLAQAEQHVAASLDDAREAVNGFIAAQTQAQTLAEKVAAANERAVAQARAAAEARTKATNDEVANERVLQEIIEQRALAEKLATEQELGQRTALANYVATANAKAVAMAKAAADARISAAQRAGAAEKLSADQAAAAAQKQVYALDQITDNIKKARAEAQTLADRLQDAFSRTGVKAANDLRSEIALVREAMQFLRTNSELTGKQLTQAFDDGNRKIQQLELQLREATGQLTLMDRAAGLMKSTFGQFAAGFVLVQAIQELGQQFLKANIQAENLSRGLNAIYKDAGTAASQIKFLNATAKAAGLEVSGISGEFVKFTAAMHTSGYGLQLTNDLFKGVANEASRLGLSTDKVSNILNAFGQIASKGTVQLEELKNQLGDALPGALKRAADALGITLQDLLKLTSEGKLLASDLLPAMANAFDKTGEAASTMSQIWANLKNSIADVSTQVADTGAWDTLKVVLLGVSQILSTIGFVIGSTFDGLTTRIRQAATLIAGMIDLNLREALKQANDIEADYTKRSEARWNKLGEATSRNVDSYNAITLASGETGKSLESLGTAAAKTTTTLVKSGAAAESAGEAHAGAVDGVKANAAAHTSAAGAATSNATAQTKVGAATESAGTQASGAGNKWIQLGLAYDKANVILDAQVKTAELHTEAVKQQVKSIEELNKVSTNQESILQGLTEASRLTMAAEADLAATRQKQVDSMISERNQMQFLIISMGDVNGERTKAVAKLDLQIAKTEELVAKDKASAESARLEMEARKLAAEVYRDNASRLDEFKAAGDKARITISELTKLLVAGRISQEDYAKGVAAASRALILEQDAYKDAIAAISRKTEIEVASNKVSTATVDISIAKAKTSEAIAKATGNEVDALSSAITIRQLEQKIQLESIASKDRQIAQYVEQTEKTRAEYEATGPLTQAKQDELKLRELNADAMRLENGQRREGIKGIDAEIDALRRKQLIASSAPGSAGNNFSKLDGITEQNAKVRSTVGGATYDKQGFATDSNGQRITAGSQLQPPDSSGDWEFVSDAANSRSTAKSNYNVPGVGYWLRKSGGSVGGGRSAGDTSNTGGLGSVFGSGGAGVRPSTPPASPAPPPPTDPYEVLGLDSPSTIDSNANAARTAFTSILNSSASMAIKQAAFAKYAQLVFAANNGQPTSELRSFASQLGLTLDVDNGELKFKTQTGDKVHIGHDSTGSATDTGAVADTGATSGAALGGSTVDTGGAGATSGSAATGGATVGGSSAGARAAALSYSTTIVIDGQSSRINVASLADLRALESTVRNIANAASRAGAS